MRKTIRYPDALVKKAVKLVGHNGVVSFNDLAIKALEEYVKKYPVDLKTKKEH